MSEDRRQSEPDAILDIEAESTSPLVIDLDDEPADTIVVDIDDEQISVPAPFSMVNVTIGPVTTDAPIREEVPVDEPEPVVSISFPHVIRMTIGGVIGGAFGWLVGESLILIPPSFYLAHLTATITLYTALVGAAIGASLGVVPGLRHGWRRAVHGGVVGLLFGGVGGALGGGEGQYLYGTLRLGYLFAPAGLVLLRAVGWSLVGLFLGLGQAAPAPSETSVRHGIVGGALGGLIGGIAFELITRGSTEHSALARFLALCTVGAALGLLLSLVAQEDR